MASKFKRRQKEKREALCQTLVSAFLPGLKESDPTNFNLAFNFVSGNLEEPALSVNPRDAENWLTSLAHRCDVDSQPDKATRLRTLVAGINQAGLKGDYEDLEARILLLLIGLSGRPLDTSVEHAAAVTRRVREQRLTAEAEAEAARAQRQAELLALIRAEDSADEEENGDVGGEERTRGAAAGGGRRAGRSAGGGGYASSSCSTLSDWSDEDGEGASAEGGRGEGPGGAGSRWQQAAATPQPTAMAAGISSLVPVARQEAASLKYPAVPDPPAYVGRQRLPPPRVLAPPDSLRARLVGAAGLPLRVAGGTTPLPRTLLALLAALQGRSSELIPWDPVECSFRPRDELYLAADVSFGTMRCAVRPLLRAATGIRRLDDWVNVCLRRRAPGPSYPQPSTAIRPGQHPNTTAAAAAAAASTPGPGGGAAQGSAGSVGSSAERGFELPAWLLQAAKVKGRGAAGVRLVQGPTLQALHQAVSSCLHALRATLVQLEQRVTNAACDATGKPPLASDAAAGSGDSPGVPSLYELIVSCQPYMRRAAGLVTAYLEVAKPLVAQLLAHTTNPGVGTAAPTAAAPAAAAGASASGTLSTSSAPSGASDGSMTARVRGTSAASAQATAGAGAAGAATAAAGAGTAGSGPGQGPLSGRSVYLQLQAGLVLERLHAMNERGWLDGVFMPLESHAHRCMLLYLYLSALDPLLDGLAEWLWTSGGTSGGAASGPPAAAAGAIGGPAAAAAGVGGGSAELPTDFFIVRGGGPGKEVSADQPAFWREGYVALTRPAHGSPLGPGTVTATAPGGNAASSSSSGSRPGAAHPGPPGAQPGAGMPGTQGSNPQAGAGAAGGPAAAAVAAGPTVASYLCPPFLEPLVPSIMAAGKSLRLRQREADIMEAAAITTAGAAGPGYAAAGSPVLDLAALEQSYAMYGLSDDLLGTYGAAWAGGGGGGGRDLKRSLMERLLSYLSAPARAQAPGATLHSILAASSGMEAVDAFPTAFAVAAPVSGSAGGGLEADAVGTAPRLPAPQNQAMVPVGGSSGNVGRDDVGSAGGLWSRMASASARLRAMCTNGVGTHSGIGRDTGAANVLPGGRGWDPAAADGLAVVAVHHPSVRAGVGPGAQHGGSSPVTPLECGVSSGTTSPGGEDAAGVAAAGRTAEDVEVEEGEGAVAHLNGWLPRRCELLLGRTAAPCAAKAAGAGGQGGGSVGGGGRSHLGGPWNRMQQLLRSGPHAALASQQRGLSQPAHHYGPAWRPSPAHPAVKSTTSIAASATVAAAALLGAAKGNAYQHPAMDLLLVHACGLAQPLAAATAAAAAAAPAAERGGVVSAVGGSGPGARGLGVAQPLGLPHPQELLRRGLVEPLQDRADHVNDALLLKLLGGWGLETRLAALPSVFLLSSPAVRSWADQLVAALLSGMRLGERPLEEPQLEQMLQEALSSAGPDDLLPPANSLVLQMSAQGPEGATAGGGGAVATGAGVAVAAAGRVPPGAKTAQEGPKFQAVQELERSVAELERLQLGLAPSWVVALVADGRVLKAYSQVLVFMLQLRWVRAALDAAHKATCLAWRKRETSAHPNSWPPLRRPGGPAPQQPPHHKRSHSAGAGDGTAAATTSGPSGGWAAGHLRGSGSAMSLLSGVASGAAAGAGASAGSGGGPGAAGGAAGGAGAGAGGRSASSARIQSSLAAMLHFMATLEQWVATQLVHDAWVQLEQDLASARSLDDVCSAHSAYTVTLLRRCFRYPGEEGSRHMGAALRKCLDACLRFAAAVSSLNGGGADKAVPMPGPGAGAAAGGRTAPGGAGGGAGSLPNPLAARLHEEALRAADAFAYWLGYLVRFVSTRALMSPSSDLGDLLMRLNYNDCYSAHFMPEELVAQQLAAQHNATAAARGWAACGPGPAPSQSARSTATMPWAAGGASAAAGPGGGGGVGSGASAAATGSVGQGMGVSSVAPAAPGRGAGAGVTGGILGGAGAYLGLASGVGGGTAPSLDATASRQLGARGQSGPVQGPAAGGPPPPPPGSRW